ncbi:MAG: hypothetical protein F4106_10170 [Gemmatimonadetes bacterium]|nr:hypothetical protein [Gemmatimonadota bacterium]MYC93124.1 hypothetical protein [Gemmatimonadota bacterium]MYG36519.1 hypothetical protein [Gemmatimonadota bacterium]MYJ18386.1 hypothetical protein [Gemmatimonadota bacterium]
MKIVTRQVAPHTVGFRAGRHPDDGNSRRYGAGTGGRRTVAHPRARENAPKPFGSMGRQDGRIVDSRPEQLCRGMQADPTRLGRREDRARHRRKRTSPAASMLGTLMPVAGA